MRTVLDTNVLLSALFTRGVCEALLDVIIESGACRLVLSDYILDEFATNACKKFGAPPKEVEQAVRYFRQHAEMVEPVSVPSDLCQDSDDLPVLGTVIAGRADVLVTGDAELLRIGEVEGARIISPRAFYDAVR